MRTGAAVPLAVALAAGSLAAGCRHRERPGDGQTQAQAADLALSPEERARKSCALQFAACAPPANIPPDTDLETVGLRTLVRISWRLDLPDRLTENAAKRLRGIVERGDLEAIREIADAADADSVTLGRCRCEGERFRPEYEKQRVGELVAARLPPRELGDPAHWVARIDAHLSKLRALSRRSAASLVGGDVRVADEVDAQLAEEERGLCEDVQAARVTLSANGMQELRELLFKARARDSGEASVDAARRLLEKAETQASCAAAGRPAPAQ